LGLESLEKDDIAELEPNEPENSHENVKKMEDTVQNIPEVEEEEEEEPTFVESKNELVIIRDGDDFYPPLISIPKEKRPPLKKKKVS